MTAPCLPYWSSASGWPLPVEEGAVLPVLPVVCADLLACGFLLRCRCYVNSSSPSSLSLTRPEVVAVWEELERARDTLAEVQALRMEVTSDTHLYSTVEGPQQMMDAPPGRRRTKGKRKNVQAVENRRRESTNKSKGKQKTAHDDSEATVQSNGEATVQSDSEATVQSAAGKNTTSIKR